MRRFWGPGALCAGSALCVGLAPALLDAACGPRSPALSALLALGALAAVAASALLFRPAAREDPLLARILLGAGAAAAIACDLFVAPSGMVLPAGFRWMAVAALIFLSAYLCLHLRASLVQARFALLLLCFAAMGAAVLRESPLGAQPAALALLALAGGAVLLARLFPGATGELAALFVLFQPRTFSLLAQGRGIFLFLAGLALVAGGGALAVSLGRRRPAAQALAAAGAAFILFPLLNEQAFCNYDWLGVSLVCGAAAAQAETA